MNCVRQEKDGVVYFTFPSFTEEGLVHGFSTRIGGVTPGEIGSMNLGFHRGDDSMNVIKNHGILADAIGYEKSSVVATDQIHETKVREVTKHDKGKGIYHAISDIRGIDGLITCDPEVTLIAYFADCVPLYFYDKTHRAIGLSHSGWRGTVQRMGQKTIDAMAKAYGTRPEDLKVIIGPSICQSCYEVSEEVADAFVAEFGSNRKDQLLTDKGNGKYQLDLWRANELVFADAGLEPGQIETAGLCTCCHPDLLFSHRASHGKRGNMAAVLTLGGKNHES